MPSIPLDCVSCTLPEELLCIVVFRCKEILASPRGLDPSKVTISHSIQTFPSASTLSVTCPEASQKACPAKITVQKPRCFVVLPLFSRSTWPNLMPFVIWLSRVCTASQSRKVGRASLQVEEEAAAAGSWRLPSSHHSPPCLTGSTIPIPPPRASLMPRISSQFTPPQTSPARLRLC